MSGQISSLSCSFSENCGQIIGWFPHHSDWGDPIWKCLDLPLLSSLFYLQLKIEISGFFWDFLMRKLTRFSGPQMDWLLPGPRGKATNQRVWMTVLSGDQLMNCGKIMDVRRNYNTIVKVVNFSGEKLRRYRKGFIHAFFGWNKRVGLSKFKMKLL